MEVVPTNDGDDDDGVIWFRCPQCQGFLPKLSAALDAGENTVSSSEHGAESKVSLTDEGEGSGASAPEPSPFLPEEEGYESASDDPINDVEPEKKKPAYTRNKAKDEEPPPPSEPIAEYAAMLAALDPGNATPYRPWGDYEVGHCVHHLAWEDCGVVVAKESLPGGRHVIKCYFEGAGVVRLIEQAPR